MVKMIINSDLKKGKINRNIYGHFTEHLGRCIYEGFWVGPDSHIPNRGGIRTDVVEALRKIHIPVLRWPGGCFADYYHWTDGIGPHEKRNLMVNSLWGGVIENNHFGTHEFLDLCEMLEAEPYICGNVGSGTIREMSDWIEYITFDGMSTISNKRRMNGREKAWGLTFFGIGNENWGCGGRMRPEFYADIYRRYSCYVKNHGENEVYKIACGASGDDYNWTEVMMKNIGSLMEGLSLHHYTSPCCSATEFGESEWFSTMKSALFMEELIAKHGAIMDLYDPEKNIGLIVDEWGLWSDPEPGTNPAFLYQQNTLRDAMVAGINLNIFNNHCDRVHMANIAQTVNVLQAMILTKGEQMILTPTYHVFDMYKVHQDAQLLDMVYENAQYSFEDDSIPALSVSASMKEDEISITLCNCHPAKEFTINCELRGTNKEFIESTILKADKMTSHNTFKNPCAVQPEKFNGAFLHDGKLTISMPSMSIAALTLK